MLLLSILMNVEMSSWSVLIIKILGWILATMNVALLVFWLVEAWNYYRLRKRFYLFVKQESQLLGPPTFQNKIGQMSNQLLQEVNSIDFLAFRVINEAKNASTVARMKKLKSEFERYDSRSNQNASNFALWFTILPLTAAAMINIDYFLSL